MQNVVWHRRQDFSLIIKSSAWQHMLLQKLCIFFNILLVVPPNMLLMLCALMTLYTITDAGFLTACWQQARCCLSSLAVHNLKKEKEKKKFTFWDPRTVFQVNSERGRKDSNLASITEHEGSLNVWWACKWCKSYTMACSDHITRVQFK